MPFPACFKDIHWRGVVSSGVCALRSGLRLVYLFCSVLGIWGGSAALAAPYIPEDDAEVLLVLPPSFLQGRALQQAHINEVARLDQALPLARQYLNLAELDGDPRWYGKAQSVLMPWWESALVPDHFRLFKARILQHKHLFDDAMEELDLVLIHQPQHVEARLNRAQIHLLQGRSELARKDCKYLALLTTADITLNCVAQVDGVTGQGEQTIEYLKQILANRTLSVEARYPIWVTLATVAHRLEYSRLAESLYRKCLEYRPDDRYVLNHYADFLLERGKTGVLTTLLQNQSDLSLKIKLTEAYIQQGDSRATESLASLDEAIELEQLAFATGRQEIVRSDKTIAQYYLRLAHRPQQAFEAAMRNWQTQKEPGDTRLVLEAALAADRMNALQPVLQFVADTRLQDSRIDQLLAKVSARLQENRHES
ncbi:MAG: hypothetical protein MI864_27525 [Pseudomonadales bacterium]|nr:hypothetical protein [Oleiphilus messinensis]MCG8614280.1 hypothetical protein [Pseudomonadales bacterium]